MVLRRFKSIILVCTAIAGFFLFSTDIQAGGLVKSATAPAVYYLEDNSLHPFPNRAVFDSWKLNLDSIITLSPEFIASLDLASNIKVKPGKALIKFETSPKVYTVSPGGVLRHLSSEIIALSLYGKNWEQKIISLPNSLFFDYYIDKPIKTANDLPDGALVKIKGNYYWKNKNILTKFGDRQAVEANDYLVSDAINQDNFYYKVRNKEIVGRQHFLNDMLALPYKSTQDCENKNLRLGVVFLYDKNFQAADLDKINNIKNDLPNSYSWATYNLSNINTQDAVYSVAITPVSYENGRIHLDEILLDFYDQHQDIYDFIILFNNFLTKEEFIANYIVINNFVSGNGKNIVFSSFNYGSAGKLKAVINMGNIGKYKIDTAGEQEQTQSYLIHELAHHWSGSAKFLDNFDQENSSLIKKDRIHWSDLVSFNSPLGGWGLKENSGGIFQSTVSSAGLLRRFSEIDLYLMGLIPDFSVKPFYYLSDIQKDDIDGTIKGVRNNVTIGQIIEAEGQYTCQAN